MFSKELEDALAEGRIDVAVHSAKDLTTDETPGLALAAVLPRADARDAWCGPHGSLAAVPQGARVGTASMRRGAQLRALRPDLSVESMRGNVDTRLRKRVERGLDGVVLAACGLDRLGLAHEIGFRVEVDMLPETGQGFLALQARSEDAAALAVVGEAEGARVLLAERSCAALLGGGCRAPVATHAVTLPDGRLWLRAWLALPDGSARRRGRRARRRRGRARRGGRGRGARARGRGDRRRGARVTVYLVGAGPGDPRLITVRGEDLLRRADVIVYDRLAGDALLDPPRPDCLLIDAGKQPGEVALTQDETTQTLIEHGRSGALVVRLKGGDPFVFGRGGEEAQALREAGVAYEIVPGVTSAISVPAYAGVPVTHRDLAAQVTIVTGHERPGKPRADVDWSELAGLPGTLVVLMGVARLGRGRGADRGRQGAGDARVRDAVGDDGRATKRRRHARDDRRRRRGRRDPLTRGHGDRPRRGAARRDRLGGGAAAARAPDRRDPRPRAGQRSRGAPARSRCRSRRMRSHPHRAPARPADRRERLWARVRDVAECAAPAAGALRRRRPGARRRDRRGDRPRDGRSPARGRHRRRRRRRGSLAEASWPRCRPI